MKNSEFTAWKKEFMTPPKMLESGELSKKDPVLKFELSYPDVEEVKKETILALTVAEAVYCAINMAIISNLPSEGSVLGCPSDEEAKKLKETFIKNSTYELAKMGDISEKSLTFIYDGKTYTLSSDEYDFSKIHKIDIQEDLISAWTYDLTDNTDTMLCTICYNLIGISINRKEMNECTDNMMISQTVRTFVMQHRNYLVMEFGYASLSPEDSGNFSTKFAEEVSYKRAILRKMRIDRMAISTNLVGMKQELEHIKNTIIKYERMLRHIKKREKDTNHYINEYINEKYPKNE